MIKKLKKTGWILLISLTLVSLLAWARMEAGDQPRDHVAEICIALAAIAYATITTLFQAFVHGLGALCARYQWARDLVGSVTACLYIFVYVPAIIFGVIYGAFMFPTLAMWVLIVVGIFGFTTFLDERYERKEKP